MKDKTVPAPQQPDRGVSPDCPDLAVVPNAAAVTLGSSYVTSAHSFGLMFENSVGSQNLQFVQMQAGMLKGAQGLLASRKSRSTGTHGVHSRPTKRLPTLS